jgi:hypothetical protein
MPNATKKAIFAVLICAALQVTLLFYSFSHPSAHGLVTASFLLAIVFYPAVFRYHANKMKALRNRSSELRRNPN